MRKLKVGPDDWAAITAIAQALRRRAAQTEPSFSTRQIIAACYPGTIVTGEELDSETDELTDVDEAAFKTHRAPNIIVYNRLASSDQRRYAIAHGLGHIIFDGPRRRGHQECALRELRCDHFADELLAPLVELAPYVGARPSEEPKAQRRYLDMADEIASHFHVPTATIHRQIKRLLAGVNEIVKF